MVAHRDRLCRFAFDLLEFIFKLNGKNLLLVLLTRQVACHLTEGCLFDDLVMPSLIAFGHLGTKLMVLSDDNPMDEWELSQDILAVNTVFICRLQGKRSAR